MSSLAFKVVRQYLRDAMAKPEIIPVTSLVIGMSSFGSYFMARKLTHTPDVNVNPAHPYNWQRYAAPSQQQQQ